jgi:hypothetical protein
LCCTGDAPSIDAAIIAIVNDAVAVVTAVTPPLSAATVLFRHG